MRLMILSACVFAAPAGAQSRYEAPPPVLKNLPNVNSMDPRSCDVKDGWQVVDIDFAGYLNRVVENKRIDPVVTQKIAVWFIEQDNVLIKEGDVKAHCLRKIAKRTEYGF